MLRTAGAARACDPGELGDEDGIVEDATLFRKKKGTYRPSKPADDRDKLLYDVTEVTPPPTALGQFRLGPSAACGDLISARDQTFVIKRAQAWRLEPLLRTARPPPSPRALRVAFLRVVTARRVLPL